MDGLEGVPSMSGKKVTDVYVGSWLSSLNRSSGSIVSDPRDVEQGDGSLVRA